MKKHRFILLLLILALATFMYSCYYDKTEVLYPKLPSSNCDTTNITYANKISEIIATNCTNNCHGASNQTTGGGISLQTSDEVKAMIDRIVGDISHTPGFNNMPKVGTKISDCSISQIIIWQKNNMP